MTMIDIPEATIASALIKINYLDVKYDRFMSIYCACNNSIIPTWSGDLTNTGSPQVTCK